MSETELHYMPHFYHVYQGYHPANYEQISAYLKTHYGRLIPPPNPTEWTESQSSKHDSSL